MNMPCSSRDCINSAVALAPQIHSEGHGGTLWKWVPACEEHLERPSIVPYHARRNSA